MIRKPRVFLIRAQGQFRGYHRLHRFCDNRYGDWWSSTHGPYQTSAQAYNAAVRHLKEVHGV